MVSDAISCLLHNLITVWDIIMILHSHVEQVMKIVWNIIMILQLCRTGHYDVSRKRMKTLTFILSELFPLDGFRCNFMSAP